MGKPAMEKEAAYRSARREIEIKGAKDKISAGMLFDVRMNAGLYLVFNDGTTFVISTTSDF